MFDYLIGVLVHKSHVENYSVTRIILIFSNETPGCDLMYFILEFCVKRIVLLAEWRKY